MNHLSAGQRQEALLASKDFAKFAQAFGPDLAQIRRDLAALRLIGSRVASRSVLHRSPTRRDSRIGESSEGRDIFLPCCKNDFKSTSRQKRFWTKNDFGTKTIFCQEEQFWPVDRRAILAA